ncbi:hypothetical protein VHEMI05822 [[Torrubiella] hemipterigena]|uniref:Peptidase S1 domain-containing protein n=1 Tax=[Torrubiella] hemipterigena TaxID=1531966 RepID=A0A0A1THL2_9HYPO|nr:hypothetical protein VHEMI05822 [[Torrubiella] hemipterigena]
MEFSSQYIIINSIITRCLIRFVLAQFLSLGLCAPHDSVFAINPTDEADPYFDSANSTFTASFRGGKAVSVKDYPFIIAGLREGGPRPKGQACTGSVIAPRKILIAAHCTEPSGHKTFVYGHDDLNKGELKKIEVVSYKMHPKYRVGEFLKGWDVGIVTTAEDIPVPGGQYAKFATSADKGIAKPGKKAFALGDGRKTPDDNSNGELHRGELPIEAPAIRLGRGSNCFPSPWYAAVLLMVNLAKFYRGIRVVLLLLTESSLALGQSTFDWYSIYGRLDGEAGDWIAEEVRKDK